MAFDFKIWNQGNDGETMGLRVADVTELTAFAAACNQPDLAGVYQDLSAYLNAANAARGVTPISYSRRIDVVWLNTIGYGTPQLFPGRTLVATYTGNERQAGGFASQCYCIVDPAGYPALAQHHQTPIRVDYITNPSHDVLVVLP